MAQPPGYPPPPPGYPPPPGGGAPPGAPPAAGADPYAAQRALDEWAAQRGYSLNNTPDFSWYQGWFPLRYAFRLARVGRELRAQFGEAALFLVEAYEADDVKRIAGEDRYLYAFVTSPRIAASVAIRAKSGGGLVNEVSRGLGSLFGSQSQASALGDPTFEQRFEVTTPSPAEGNRALPMPLRQFLLQTSWRGIVETRPGGMLVIPFDRRSFDPVTLDQVINNVGQLYQLIVG